MPNWKASSRLQKNANLMIIGKQGSGARARWILVATLCTVEFVNVLGTTILIVALPTMQRQLNASDSVRDQIAGVYALFFGGFLIVAGRLVDLYGARRLFFIGMAVIGLALVLCSAALTGFMLMAGRALQGFGAAIAVPAALSMVMGTFPEEHNRTRALAWWTAAGAAGGAIGLAAGGVVTDVLNWRWIFLFNLPVVLLALAIVHMLVPSEAKRHAHTEVDVRSAALLTGGLLMLIFGLTSVAAAGFDLLRVVLPVGLSVTVLALAIAIERRSSQPLVPGRLLRIRAFIGSCGVAFILTTTTSAAGVLLTLYLQNVLDRGAAATGMLLAPFSVAVVLGAGAGSRSAARLGYKATMILGLFGIGVAMSAYALWLPDRELGCIVVAWFISGVGLGLASVASTTFGLANAPTGEDGIASGLLNSAAQLGTAIGIAVLTTVASLVAGRGGVAHPADRDLIAGFQYAFGIAGILALVTIPLAWWSGRAQPTSGA
ncbi:MAG: MFS transporter [Thermomicrobiales bacterium]